MANPTTNFGWVMPTATDLVTDLPADFAVFGQGVDTSMAGLLGGTTGQVLSKTSGTNMAFTWVTANPGDITAVTTTAPLQGGSTSGAVALTVDAASTSASGVVQLSNSTSTTSSVLAATPTAVKSAYDLADGAIAKTTVTTAGDIIYRNATVPTRLGIGTAGQVLTVNSGATAPQWSTPAGGGGKVLQVVQGQTTTSTTIATTAYTDTTITATITPTLNTSKILIIINGQCRYSRNSAYQGVGALVKRGSTTIVDYLDYGLAYFQADGATLASGGGTYNITYLDSPATTSSTTYKLQAKVWVTTNSGTSYWQIDGPSQIILMEIGA